MDLSVAGSNPVRLGNQTVAQLDRATESNFCRFIPPSVQITRAVVQDRDTYGGSAGRNVGGSWFDPSLRRKAR
jgi:hypothetical protein